MAETNTTPKYPVPPTPAGTPGVDTTRAATVPEPLIGNGRLRNRTQAQKDNAVVMEQRWKFSPGPLARLRAATRAALRR